MKDVAFWRLCVGCGACKYICPEDKIKLIDVVDYGIRPIIDSNDCGDCQECLNVCPGYDVEHQNLKASATLITELLKSFGPILEIWEGHAADPEIRFCGSSGGLITALALYCLQEEGIYGILHSAADPDYPWKNKTVLSRKRAELLLRTGSRYSPASPCDGLSQIEAATGPCVFIGKPCDVSGLRKSQLLKPELVPKIALVMSFFCAGAPSTQGTLDFFKAYSVEPEDVAEMRYRGNGWPGKATVKFKGAEPDLEVNYKDSWGFIQKYRPFRCYLCPDLTGEFADISFGDPWYREIKEDDPGHSLILVRTEKGRKMFHKAVSAGYVTADRADAGILYHSQKNLLRKRQALWGRLLAMKALGVPTPKLGGFHLFENWLDLPVAEKARSILGTIRRIVQRKYFIPMEFDT